MSISDISKSQISQYNPEPTTTIVDDEIRDLEFDTTDTDKKVKFPLMGQGPAKLFEDDENYYTNPDLHRRMYEDISLTAEGEYDSETLYYVGNNVKYNNAMYQAIRNTQGNAPEIDGVVDESHWVKIYGADPVPVDISLGIQHVYSYRTTETKVHNDEFGFDEIEIP